MARTTDTYTRATEDGDMTYHENLDRLERDASWHGAESPSREADPLHYHWGQNVPGYLPMADEANFASDFDTARDALMEDVDRIIDQTDETTPYEGSMLAALHTVLAEISEWETEGVTYAASDQPHDLGLAFWVSSCAEEECWHDSDIGRANLASATILLAVALAGVAGLGQLIGAAVAGFGGMA